MRTKQLMQPILAGIVSVGFFGVIFCMIVYDIPERAGEALLVLLGALGTSFTGMLAFFFGSSAGSRDKDDVIASMVAKATKKES